MKILADSVIPWLDKLFCVHGEIIRYSGREIDLSQLDGVDILLIRSTLRVTKDLLNDTSVKFVGSATVGCDHVDQNALKDLGITFAHAPGCNANAVCEYVVSAISWHAAKGLISFEKNPTAAVIGCGRIGSEVKQKLEKLGFDVVVNDPPLQLTRSKSWKFVNLEQALQADVICLHTPLTKTGRFPTYHLIDKTQLEHINPTAILINAGRGEVINNPALLNTLEINPKLNVVLDVWENEPEINLQLLNRVNLGTPHIAGHSWRGKVMGTVMIYRQACDFFGWRPQDIDESDFKVLVSSSKFNQHDSLYDVVRQCYDIESDANILRERFAELSASQRGRAFDDLRKNYYRRPEFCDLICEAGQEEFRDLLQKLNFSVAAR